MVRESPSCRVCTKKSKDAITLEAMYNKKCNLTYLDCFNISTHLDASIDDGLPIALCTQCRDILKSTFRFLEKAKETDKRLREKLGLVIVRSKNSAIKEELFENAVSAEETIAEIKTEFISCAKDPLDDSELEDEENKSEEELELDWGLGDSRHYDSNDDKKDVDFDDEDEEFNKPLKDLIKKEYLTKTKVQPGTSGDFEEFDSKTTEEDLCKLLDGDNYCGKIAETPIIPTTIENAIFPIGRYMCKICKKTYFTESGLKFHINVHLPKQRRAKIRSDKGIKRKKGDKKKNDNGNYSEISDDGKKEETEISTDVETKEDRQINATNKESESTIQIGIHDDNQGGKEKKKRKEKIPKPKKTFPCHVCGRHMISASKLRYHMVMHTGEKDYLCTQCPKAYSTIYALKHHMRTHTGERPYECKFCGDRFTRPTTLKSHMRRHTGERPYGCDICGKRFIQHSSMTTHMKLNHMAKNIQCPHCDKKYARQTDLNTHLLSHTGDKPFSCQLCPSRFIRQANLNKHMNIHHAGIKASKESKPSAVYVAAAAAFAASTSAGSGTIPCIPTTNVNNYGNTNNTVISIGPSSNNSSTSNNTMPPPLIATGGLNRINTQTGTELHNTHITQNMEPVDHLKVIHPQVDNLTNLLGQVIDTDRPVRTVDDIMRWGWPSNS